MLFLRLPCCEGQAILLSCGAPRRRPLPDGAGVARTMQSVPRHGLAWPFSSRHSTKRSQTALHHTTLHHITRHHPNRSQAKRHDTTDTTDTTPPGRKRCQGNGMVLHEPKPGEMAWRCKASPIASASTNVSATAGKLPTHATLPPARIASATPVPCSVPSGACHRRPAVFDRRAHCNWTCEILTYIIRPPFPDSSVGRATDC